MLRERMTKSLMKTTHFIGLITLCAFQVTCGESTAPSQMMELEKGGESVGGDVPLAGISAGTESGTESGTEAGETAGISAGSEAGEPAGAEAGEPAGAEAGEPAGAEAGEPAGAEAGVPAGAEAGEPAGAEAGVPAGSEAGVPAGAEAGELAGEMGGHDFSWLSEAPAADLTRFDAACNTPQMLFSDEQEVLIEPYMTRVEVTLGQSSIAIIARAEPTVDQISNAVRDQELMVYPGIIQAGQRINLSSAFRVNDVVGTGGLISDLAVSKIKGDDRLVIVARVGSLLKIIYISLLERDWISYDLELNTEQVSDLSVQLGSRIHIAARVNNRVKLWRIHPQTGEQERDLIIGSQVNQLKTALNGDQLGVLYQEGSTWEWCVVSTISYNQCAELPSLQFITPTDDPAGLNLVEAKIAPRTWLISLAGGGMLRGVTIDTNGVLLNTGTITLDQPYLTAQPNLKLERVVGGGFIASTIGVQSPLQVFTAVPTVYPMTYLGQWSLGQNIDISRSDSTLTSQDRSRWAVLGTLDRELGQYRARIAELSCAD